MKLGERLLIIAIDGILPSSPMTKEEAMEELRADVREDILAKRLQNNAKNKKL